jgi:hypothetical protein
LSGSSGVLAHPGGPGLAGLISESAIGVKAARRFAELQPWPRASKGAAAGEKTSNKYLRYYSAMDSGSGPQPAGSRQPQTRTVQTRNQQLFSSW